MKVFYFEIKHFGVIVSNSVNLGCILEAERMTVRFIKIHKSISVFNVRKLKNKKQGEQL
jgi:hypothetical protein